MLRGELRFSSGGNETGMDVARYWVQCCAGPVRLMVTSASEDTIEILKNYRCCEQQSPYSYPDDAPCTITQCCEAKCSTNSHLTLHSPHTRCSTITCVHRPRLYTATRSCDAERAPRSWYPGRTAVGHTVPSINAASGRSNLHRTLSAVLGIICWYCTRFEDA